MSWRHKLTLQSQLMLTVYAIVAAILVVVALVTSFVLQNVLNQQLDERLRQVASAPLSLSQDANSGVPALTDDMLVVGTTDGSTWKGVYTDDYAVSGMTTAQVAQVYAAVSGLDHGQHVTVSVSGLGTFRVEAVSVSDSSDVVTAIGISNASEVETLTRMLWAIALITMGGMLVLGVATSGTISRGLRPLRTIAATATRVSRQQLDQGDVEIAERVPASQVNPYTEIGQVGAALNTLLDHVEESLSARQRNEETMRKFVADASHELRTPLASIRGYSELSQRDPALSDGSRQSLERIEAQAQRMTGLVEDLLLLARLDEGHELMYDVIDMRQLVVDAVADQAMAGMEHDWGADVGEEPVQVAGDRARLTQVITNLLANARTHTPEGTEVTVGLRTEGEGSATRAVLTVHDSGPGIDPELQKSLFTRFTRGDQSRARKTGGSGLGLSIAQAIVTGHHGTISVESEPGSTTFTVTLPAKPQDGVVGSTSPQPIP
ncbi:sensor histidine kinase [Microbacterium indicum]|uniref:sensor histidine kinase n=1 Tax=Microbacterium indicum TaxID=358100 RepID=UPI001FDFD158|nr:ATP-binding protein [Microbacterium indicum]